MSHHKKPLLEVWLREWRRITLKWPFLFVTFVGPLIAFFLLAWIFEEGTPRKLPVAIVDHDKTNISRQISRFVDATPIASVDRSYVNLNEAKLAMEKGKADAVLFIPEHTEKKILTGQGTDIELFVNNENVVKGGLISSGVRKAVATLSTGIKLRTQLQKGITQDQALARVQPVMLRSNVMFNPYISYPYYITAGLMPALLMVFCLLGTIYSFGTELFKGSGLKLVNSAGGDMRIAIVGKLLPYTLIYFCMAMIINIFNFVFLGTPLNGNVFIILFSQLLLIIAYQFMGLFIVGLLGNMRLAMSLGSAYSMLALTYCGLTFPAMAMPSVAKAFSLIFPYTYWVKVFVGQSLRFEPLSSAMHYLMAIVCFIFLGLTMVPRYRYLLVTKKAWGKE